MRIIAEGLTGSEHVQAEIDSELKNNIAGYVSPGLLQALEELDPPLNNMGGIPTSTPYFVSQYEKQLDKLVSFETRVDLSRVQKTVLDWLGFSFVIPGDELSGITSIEYGLKAIWPNVQIVKATVGMRGYPQCKAIFEDGVQLGLIGYGAKHNRNSVTLTGVACRTLTHERMALMYELLQVLDARLSRVDIALDLYHGEMTWDYALFAYERGDFKPVRGPSPQKKVVESTGSQGQNMGRTLYVGARDGHCMGRIYEKGLEVLGRMPEDYREACTQREAEYYAARGAAVPTGTIADDWLRLEAEYKYKDKERPLPLEMILDRDLFFAGAYGFFASALGMTDGRRPETLKTDEQIELDKMIQAMRNSYGNTVYSLTQLGFTPEEIVEFVSTGVHNQRMVKAGLLRVIENDAKWKEAMESKKAQDFDVPF